MSFINFEKGTGKYFTKEEIEEKRKEIALKWETKVKEKKKSEFRNQLTEEKQWLLPSLDEQLRSSSHKKKKKKKSKKVKHKKKKKRSSSSDSDDSTDDEEEKWVEKKIEEPKAELQQRDDWMSISLLCTSRDEKKPKEKEVNRCIIEKPGQSTRELNPYWKDGGTGVPEEEKDLSLVKSSVGDQGLDWLKRALQRSKEIAKEEGRDLEDVVSERWGSLRKLESLIAEAEERQNKERNKNRDRESRRRHSPHRQDRNYSSRHQPSDRSNNDGDDKREHSSSRYSGTYSRHDDRKSSRYRGDRSRSRDNDDNSKRSSNYSVRDKTYRKPDRRGEDVKMVDRLHSDKKFLFKKPTDDDIVQNSNSSSSHQTKNWMKKEFRGKIVETNPSDDRRKKASSSSSSDDEEEVKATEGVKVLSDAELNILASKLVKAEILGNDDLAKQLKVELEKAKQMREEAVNTAGSSTGTKEVEVLLTKTTSQGLERPMQSSGRREPLGGRRKKQRVDTHKDGERVRYFPDDDKYNLKQMFEKEKFRTITEGTEEFIKLMSKTKADDLSDEESFLETAQMKEADGKIVERERKMAIKESNRKMKSVDRCRWCLDNKERAKHLLVAIGEKCYLCLPEEESLTEGHCLVVPVQHVTCATLLDEDVWEEMTLFRRKLTEMFLSRNMDVVFFENARSFHKYPHMVLHCVPIEKEVGDMAPIYFKKAILDSEIEWSTNKKLVELSKKNVRSSIPKGLPYFCVDFGNDGGFAHVIEDEKLFPANFAQQVIGGMLDLDHRKWRNKQKESFNVQRDKVLLFAKHWKPYDFTKKNRSSSDSSSD